MASVSSRPERKLDSVTPRAAMMTARMDNNSKIHAAAALFQLITDLPDSLDELRRGEFEDFHNLYN